MIWDCALCAATWRVADVEEVVDHLRDRHPEVYGTGPDRWPDGRVVIYDPDPDPADFGALP